MLTVTTQARIDLARARWGEIEMPSIDSIEFGDGGHDASNNEKPVDPLLQNLIHKIDAKAAAKVSRDGRKNTYRIEIQESEFIGETFSEIGLRASNGTLVAVDHFPPKIKDGNSIFSFTIDEEF